MILTPFPFIVCNSNAMFRLRYTPGDLEVTLTLSILSLPDQQVGILGKKLNRDDLASVAAHLLNLK